MEEALRTFMNAFGGGRGGGGESIFDSFFGFDSDPSTAGMRQGASKKMNLTISFAESMKGVEKEAAITTYDSCATCSGSGEICIVNDTLECVYIETGIFLLLCDEKKGPYRKIV